MVQAVLNSFASVSSNKQIYTCLEDAARIQQIGFSFIHFHTCFFL